MSKSNTFRSAISALGLIMLLAQAGQAQSTLNFPRVVRDGSVNTGIAITNPTPYFADVQMTFYGLDGNLVANAPVNPAAYRIAPHSQLSRMASELFAAGRTEGWIQVTSTSPGLFGLSFVGDFMSQLEGSETASPLNSQSIPFLRDDPNSTEVLVTNPGSTAANVNVIQYNSNGDEINTPTNVVLSPHAVLKMTSAPGATWARVTSSVGVLATGVLVDQNAMMFVNGQPTDQTATMRVVPHFQSGNGFDAQLILSNPNASAVNVTVNLYSETGGIVYPAQQGPLSITIPARGSTVADTRRLIGQLAAPPVNGWLQIDSPNVALTGVVVLDSAVSLTAIPVQRTGLDRMMFSQLIDSRDLSSSLAIVNPAVANTAVSVSVLRADGTVFGQRTVSIPGRTKVYIRPHDLIPETAGFTGGFVAIRATSPIFAIEMMETPANTFQAAVVPQRPNLDFIPNLEPDIPRITRLDPGTEITPGTRLNIAVSSTSVDTQVLLGGFTITPLFPAPGAGFMYADVPAIEPGYANLRVRVRGVESDPIRIKILPVEDLQPWKDVPGQAFYQKIDVTDSGLELNRRTLVPIRNARVEILDAINQSLISVSETDSFGRFTALVPQSSEVIIRVMSRLRQGNLRVVDNSNGDALYSIQTPFDPRESSQALILDTTRVSGAFNILEMIQRGNDLVRLADPKVITPAPAIRWSIRNTAATGFSITTNTAYIRGDRATDSDEFDDAVILHEYAHILAVRFSRDDSPGGAHGVGDALDPRLAWSEGWANFFAGAVRNDPIYRDSSETSASRVFRIDLEDNRPVNDKPGYESEASIHSLLWDMFDSVADAADNVQYPFSMIWDAVTDLRNDRFVYLPYFLERFLARNPSEIETVRNMVVVRSIDFQPNVRPSVTNPFPRVTAVGGNVQGSLDSVTFRRWNLAQSSHFYTFSTTSEAALAIRMDITGLGLGGNPNANDLDIFLLDSNGRVIDGSDRGLNGQSELIARRLTAGTYVIEVRSYYLKADSSGQYVYNSGDYRLSLTPQ